MSLRSRPILSSRQTTKCDVATCDAVIFGPPRARSIRCHITWCAIVPNNPQGPVQTQSGIVSHSPPCETTPFISRSSPLGHFIRCTTSPERLPGRTTLPRHSDVAPGRDTVWRKSRGLPTYAADDCSGRDGAFLRTTPTLWTDRIHRASNSKSAGIAHVSLRTHGCYRARWL